MVHRHIVIENSIPFLVGDDMKHMFGPRINEYEMSF